MTFCDGGEISSDKRDKYINKSTTFRSKKRKLRKTWKTDVLPFTLLYRQIRDTVHWMFSEPMLVYYIGVFRDAFWPNGKLAPPPRAKSDKQKQETKQRAQQKLLENIPGEIIFILLNLKFNS